jgi:hypothetical protein
MDARRGSVEFAEADELEPLLLVAVPGRRPRAGLSAEGCAPDGIDTMDLRRIAKWSATVYAVRR